jgi:hypothetical protein
MPSCEQITPDAAVVRRLAAVGSVLRFGFVNHIAMHFSTSMGPSQTVMLRRAARSWQFLQLSY